MSRKEDRKGRSKQGRELEASRSRGAVEDEDW